MTAPALKAYVVTLCFAGAEQNGPVHTSVILAPGQTAAAATVMHTLMREQPTELPLTCCIATEIEAAYLRHLLRAVEGKLPESGTADVLSLVQMRADARKRTEKIQGHEADTWIVDDMNGDPRQPIGGGLPLDAADAATFPWPAATRLWNMQNVRAFDYGEQFGPPMPDGAS